MQLVRRIRQSTSHPPKVAEISLPWGSALVISPGEDIGRCLWTTGVYEPAVTEILWRLVDAGDVTVDAGANIGYMTSVLAARVGCNGRVYAFEPHPQVRARLRENIENWRRTLGWSQIQECPSALSNGSGSGFLHTGAGFDTNQGTASFTPQSPNTLRIEVARTTLDDVVGNESSIALLKLDVEGHEHEALLGASRLLERGAIRDIVFESSCEPQRPIELLERHGYQVFRILRGLLKPLLKPARSSSPPSWEPPNYLATRDAARCLERLRPFGWRMLAGSPESR